MVQRLVLALTLQALLASALLDLNCTVGGNYAPNAFSCEDVVDPAACRALYPPPTAVPAVGNNNERYGTCFDNVNPGVAPKDSMRTAAVSICPKSCGYCCLTPAFNCRNSLTPKYLTNCASVTKAMCNDANWREYIAQDCPSSCGFCLEGGCVDAAVECAAQPGICNNINMQDFVKAKCKRTCNLCAATATTAAPGVVTTTRTTGTCSDISPNCAAWVRRGYCTNSFYTNADRVKYCPNSCGLCALVGK